MAELVDALVSNTSNFTVVSVRVRPEVQKIRVRVKARAKTLETLIFFIQKLTLTLTYMFDFEKLDVYQKAKNFNSQGYKYIQTNKNFDSTTKNQLRRASLSIMLNIA